MLKQQKNKVTWILYVDKTKIHDKRPKWNVKGNGNTLYFVESKRKETLSTLQLRNRRYFKTNKSYYKEEKYVQSEKYTTSVYQHIT